jgi:hypothetical protein
MNMLVLGGTVFFRRHLVAALIANGHRVTTFNRGTHRDVDGELPLTRIAGDRTVAAERERIPPAGWDAVVDPRADVPDVVEAAARRPYDPSDRFTYWPVRIARGGDVLVPGPPERGVQFIDVRDLAGYWVDGAFLAGQGCAGWSDLPLWIRPDSPYPGIFAVDVSRAVAAGLRLRATR